jgi:hypothetical protein
MNRTAVASELPVILGCTTTQIAKSTVLPDFHAPRCAKRPERATMVTHRIRFAAGRCNIAAVTKAQYSGKLKALHGALYALVAAEITSW